MVAAVEEIPILINAFVEDGGAVARIFAARHGLGIKLDHIESALVEVYGLKEPTVVADLLDLRLSRDEMVSKLADFDFRCFFPVAEIAFENSIIPPGVPTRLDEQTVKCRGERWRVHKTDGHGFPSNPHAHNLESGLKLHLGTGGLFLKKRQVGKISPKDLMFIRGELIGFDLPHLSC